MWIEVKRKFRIVVKSIVAYTLVGVAATGILWLIYPETFVDYVPAMGAFFVTAGIILSLILDRAHQNYNSRKLISIYMLSRVIKLVLTIGFLWAFTRFTECEVKPFAISLMIFYLTYMFLDLYVYVLFNKKIKKGGNAVTK